MSCAGTPGCCERHPKLSGCISRSSAARGSGSSTPQDPGTAAKTASALDHLGASLLGLPNAVERYARFRVEAPRATNVPIPDVVSLGSRVNYSDFLSAHPPLTLTTGQRKARRLALCLWGIPGTMQGMSRELELDATSVFQSAHSVIHQVLMPAETAGWTTAAFAHSWLPPSMKAAQQELLKRSIREAYGSRLKGSRHEALGGLTAERITSFALSIVASLELARAHAVAEGSAFDLVCAARYDWFVHRTLDLSLVDPTALTTATWCTHSAHAGSYGRGKLEDSDRCGQLRLVDASFGVSDYFHLGGQTLLEWVFGSLLLHRLSGLTRDASKAAQQLSFPPLCLESPKVRREGLDRCQKLHFVLEAHFEALGLKQRRLLRSHPAAVERVHFTLFRDRFVVLEVSESELLAARSGAGGTMCDRRRLCARRHPSAALRDAEAAWTRNPKVSQV